MYPFFSSPLPTRALSLSTSEMAALFTMLMMALLFVSRAHAAATFQSVPALIDRRTQIQGNAAIDVDVTIVPSGALIILGNLTMTPTATVVLKDGGGFQPIYVSQIARINDGRLRLEYNSTLTSPVQTLTVLLADGGIVSGFDVRTASDTNPCATVSAAGFIQGNEFKVNVTSNLVTCANSGGTTATAVAVASTTTPSTVTRVPTSKGSQKETTPVAVTMMMMFIVMLVNIVGVI